MSVFCILHIQSESISILPNGLLKAEARANMEFSDLGSPEWILKRQRMGKRLGREWQAPAARYHWKLCSKDFVLSEEIHDHIAWIFGCVTPPLSLAEHLSDEYAYFLSTYWGVDGPGGGPKILLETSALLVKHQVELEISLYPKDSSIPPSYS